MTMRRLTVALLILAAIPHLQCSRSRRPASSGKDPKVLIQQKYPPGRYVLTQVQTTKQRIKGKGVNQTASQTMTVVMGTDTSVPDGEGVKTMTVTFRRIKMDGQGLSVDTDNPPSGRGGSPNEIMDRVYRRFLDVRITTRIGPDEKILSVSGLDDLWDTVAREVPSAAGMVQQFKAGFNEETMRELIGAQSKLLPAGPVGVGAIWHPKYTLTVPVAGVASFDSEAELLELDETPDGTIARIRVIGSAASKGGDKLSVAGGSVRIKEMDIDQDMTLTLNVDSGVVTNLEMTQTGKVKMSVRPPAGRSQDMTSHLDQTITQTVEPEN